MHWVITFVYIKCIHKLIHVEIQKIIHAYEYYVAHIFVSSKNKQHHEHFAFNIYANVIEILCSESTCVLNAHVHFHRCRFFALFFSDVTINKILTFKNQ